MFFPWKDNPFTRQGNQRAHPRWTEEEDTLIRLMREDGRSVKFIAEQIKRSVHAVNDRLTKGLRVIRHKKHVVHHKPSVEPNVEQVEVLKFLLPTYYESGWRVTKFVGDTVVLERAKYDQPTYKVSTNSL